MREKVLLKTSIYDYELPEFNKMTENNDIILDSNTPTLLSTPQPTLSNAEIEGVNNELTMPDNIDSTTRPISVLEQHLTPNEQDTKALNNSNALNKCDSSAISEN